MRAFVTDALVAVRLDDIPASVHREYYETAMRLERAALEREADEAARRPGVPEGGDETLFSGLVLL